MKTQNSRIQHPLLSLQSGGPTRAHARLKLSIYLWIALAALVPATHAARAGAGPHIFPSARTYPFGVFPDRIVVADFNGDGIQDIASADASGFANILLGTRDGFTPPVSYPAGQLPQSIALGDFNRDGKVDLALADSDGAQIQILLSNGDGTFQLASAYPGGDYPVDLAVADFNHDGILDVAAVEGHTAAVSVFLGLAQGGFAPPVTYDLSADSLNGSLVIADFNQDGNADIAVANAGAALGPGQTVSLFLGAGDGTFGPKNDFAVGKQPFGITTADFNNDGKPDLATVNFLDGTASVLIGNGDGSFQPMMSYQAGIGAPLGPIGIAAARPSKSGNVVLAISGDTGTFILVANGDGTFRSAGSYDPAGTRLAFGDFNRDGRADVAVIDRNHSSLALLLGDGSGGFRAPHDYFTGAAPVNLVTGDFNEDGKPDFSVVNLDATNISVLLGQGDGTFQAMKQYECGSAPSGIAMGDVNGDGHLDVVVTNGLSPAGTITVLLGDGKGAFRKAKSYDAGDLPFADVVADLNGDGRLDVAAVNFLGNDLSVFLGNGDGTFQPAVSVSVGEAPACVIAADFNQDSHLDLAVADRITDSNGNGTVMTLLGAGDGTFLPGIAASTGSNPNFIAVGDFNGDSKLDMAVANSGENDVSVLSGNADGTFSPPLNFSVGDVPPWRISTADFNGDGNLDLATANAGDGFGNTVTILKGNGKGKFRLRDTITVGLDAQTVAVGDYNLDGAPDLAVTNALEDSVAILLNRHPAP